MGFERYTEEETQIEITQGVLIGEQCFVNGYREDDLNFPSNPDSIMAEVYKQIKWKNLPKLSKDFKVYVSIKTGITDSLTIIRNKAPDFYVQEVQRVIDGFPKLRKFYFRDEPLEESYVLQVIFSNKLRKRYAR